VLRVTADTNIYIFTLNFGGMLEPSLLLAENGSIQLVTSDAILAEVVMGLRGNQLAWPPSYPVTKA
jgi:predicted nucleic acid-binding protein